MHEARQTLHEMIVENVSEPVSKYGLHERIVENGLDVKWT